ncbi:hypothetical protein LCGC14_1027910, partial [marine sediment metagenome]
KIRVIGDLFLEADYLKKNEKNY